LTTGNDGPDRDPMRYVLLGSNFDLAWADQAWTPIATGQTGLSTARRATNTVAFDNTQSFKYYKLMLVDLRNAASAVGMQVSEVRLGNTLSSNAAATSAVQLAELSLVTAQSDVASPGVVPFGSGAAAALDGDRGTKYVNAAKAGSGLLTALAVPRVVNRIDFTIGLGQHRLDAGGQRGHWLEHRPRCNQHGGLCQQPEFPVLQAGVHRVAFSDGRIDADRRRLPRRHVAARPGL
jgi:hypothetical protein